MYVGVFVYLLQIAFISVVFDVRLIHVHVNWKFSQDKLLVLLNLYNVSINKVVLIVICCSKMYCKVNYSSQRSISSIELVWSVKLLGLPLKLLTCVETASQLWTTAYKTSLLKSNRWCWTFFVAYFRALGTRVTGQVARSHVARKPESKPEKTARNLSRVARNFSNSSLHWSAKVFIALLETKKKFLKLTKCSWVRNESYQTNNASFFARNGERSLCC